MTRRAQWKQWPGRCSAPFRSLRTRYKLVWRSGGKNKKPRLKAVER